MAALSRFDRALNAYVKEHVRPLLEPRIARLITLANMDLCVGTGSFDDDDRAEYPGFSSACRLIARDAGDICEAVTIDADGFPVDEEDADESCYQIEPHDALRALVGGTLFTYL